MFSPMHTGRDVREEDGDSGWDGNPGRLSKSDAVIAWLSLAAIMADAILGLLTAWRATG